MIETMPYSKFSSVYDEVMDHVDFQEWANFIIGSWKETKLPDKILDLGCGSGTLLNHFPSSIGTKVGIDSSLQMLEMAKKKYPKIQYIQSDIIYFSLKEKFPLVVSTHDTLNYILQPEKLITHFQTVNKNMELGGYYFFDLSSEYNLIHNFHKKQLFYNIDSVKLTWRNTYNQKRKVITSTLIFSIFKDLKIQKYRETHYQKFHPHSIILKILQKTGFSLVSIGSDYKTWTLKKDCCLINYLAKKIKEIK